MQHSESVVLGVFVWNRQRREYDYDQEKYVTIENQRSEWEIHKDPKLAFVPKELWRASWLKLLRTRKAHPLAGKKQSHNQNSATTLFSGTLFCEHCESELRLNRSAGKYKVMSCLSGSTGVHDCPLTTSKSTQIMEDCLLGYIGDFVLTERVIEGLVQKVFPDRPDWPGKADLRVNYFLPLTSCLHPRVLREWLCFPIWPHPLRGGLVP